MEPIEQVKKLSHEVVTSHNVRGFSLVRLVPDAEDGGGVLLNMTRNPLVVQGPKLTAKAHVRRWLWEQKTVRRPRRTWLWSRYVKEEDVSLMGLATATSLEAARRMSSIDPAYEWIEVDL